MKKITATLALMAGMALLTVSACATDMPLQTSGGDGSRAIIYGSLDAVVNASSLSISGTVTKQTLQKSPPEDQSPYTLSTVRVTAVLNGTGAAVGQSVEVRQLGLAEDGSTAPFLTVDSKYILLLTPSGLKGDAASEYYITGGTAGLWKAESGSAVSGDESYVQILNEGDDLPQSITAGDFSR